MIMEPSETLKPLLEKVRNYINNAIIPLDQEFVDEIDNNGRWTHSPRQKEILDQLKQGARDQGLWNFFLTEGEHSSGLSTVDYAFIAEETGRSALAAEVFNCSAPDTGNMEVLAKYGSQAQKDRWLEPLLNGEIRSAYAMTEPGSASSDATNISSRFLIH